jgi:hypothetical protein
MIKRALLVLLSFLLFVACNNPGRRHTEEKQALQEELETSQDSEEHKDPDGAFGAKDFASEARERSERDTKALEEAVEETNAD